MARCNCNHIDHCDFTCLNDYSIEEICKHPNQLTQVLEAYGPCETTIEVCADCGEPLTEPKTDC